MSMICFEMFCIVVFDRSGWKSVFFGGWLSASLEMEAFDTSLFRV